MELLILGLVAFGLFTLGSEKAANASEPVNPHKPKETDSKEATPPTSKFPTEYQYPQSTSGTKDRALLVQPKLFGSNDPWEVASAAAKMITGDSRRAPEILAANACVVFIAIPGVVSKTVLQPDDQLLVPEHWKLYINQKVQGTAGQALPPYPEGAPFQVVPLPDKLVCSA